MRIILTLILCLFSFNAMSDEEVPKTTLKLGLQLLKQNTQNYLVINYENHPKWHTYWKNPGDAGLPIKNVFTVDGKEIQFQEMQLPAPKRFIEPGDMWAYGYDGDYSFFYQINRQDFNKWAGKEIQLKSSWLICKHICVPGQQIIKFKISPDQLTLATPAVLANYETGILAERLNNLPQVTTLPDYLSLELYKGEEDKQLHLVYRVKNTTDTQFLKNNNLLYPFPLSPFDFKHEALALSDSEIRGSMKVAWDGEYLSPVIDFPKDGKFKTPYTLKFIFSDPFTKKPVVIEKTFRSFQVTPIKLESEAHKEVALESPSGAPVKVINSKEISNSMIYYLVLAFIGGLILNIMPCVLPVISIKLFGLVKYKNESHKTILKHNFFYSLGIVFTFLVLASIVLSLKSIGTQVGWGFQLQSPTFVSLMIIGLFIFALNLFGLFEFKTPGGSKLGNVEIKDTFVGDFLSGVLATILSTPCSAPFLGTALTFAFTSSPLEIYLIFIMIGLGLAFPFILTAIYPKLVSFIPRPGNWMNTAKKILGFTLILTVLWLFDVYNTLVNGSSHLIKLATVLVFINAAFFLFKKKEKWIGAIGFLLALGLFINLTSSEIIDAPTADSPLLRDKQSKGLDWEIWSEEAMLAHKNSSNLVFIDFTAKWCFTCKVNEKLVLETEEFKKLVKEKDIKLLLADWTKRDEIIGSFLKRNGMVGVPAYFIQRPDGTLVNLGETITVKRISENLQ